MGWDRGGQRRGVGSCKGRRCPGPGESGDSDMGGVQTGWQLSCEPEGPVALTPKVCGFYLQLHVGTPWRHLKMLIPGC